MRLDERIKRANQISEAIAAGDLAHANRIISGAHVNRGLDRLIGDMNLADQIEQLDITRQRHSAAVNKFLAGLDEMDRQEAMAREAHAELMDDMRDLGDRFDGLG